MKSVKIKIFCLSMLIACAAMISCGHPRAGDDDYVEWVRDYKNGMHARHVQSDLAYDLQFEPAEYVWMQRNGSFDERSFEADHDEFDKMNYFVLNINSADGSKDVIKQRAQGNSQVANELLYYFSYRFQDDIALEESTEHKPVLLFHYEQHGTKSFVLGFEKGDNPTKDVTLTITSGVLDSIPVKIKVTTDPKVL